jgi:hypothetical protein
MWATTMRRDPTTNAATKLTGTVRAILDDKDGVIRSIGPTETVYAAVAKLKEWSVGALLVMQDSKLLGMFSERDYALKVILDSALFRGHGASQQNIKTPMEFTISAIRALRLGNTDTNGHVTASADTDGYGLGGTGGNTSPLSRMGGMGLFNKAEPDGYSEYGRIWMNTANLCERMRYVQHLLMLTSSTTKDDDYGSPGVKNTSDPVSVLRSRLNAGSLTDAGSVVDVFLDILFPGEGRANLSLDRASAIEFLNTSEAGVSSPFSDLTVGTAGYEGRVRSMAAWLMCLPRFQEQ